MWFHPDTYISACVSNGARSHALKYAYALSPLEAQHSVICISLQMFRYIFTELDTIKFENPLTEKGDFKSNMYICVYLYVIKIGIMYQNENQLCRI